MSNPYLRIGSAAAATLLVLAAGACSNNSPSSSTSAPPDFNQRGPITLAIGKDTTGNLQKELDGWNAQHPDQKVTLIELPESADQQRNLMLQAFQTKSDQYTVLGTDIVWTSEFAANSWVVPLDESKFPVGEMLPAAVATGKYRDKLYAVPQTTNGALFYYRKDLLDSVGAQPPKTMDEVKQICARIKATPQGASMDCYGGQFNKYEGLTVNFSEAVGGSGGRVVDQAGKATVDSPQAISATKWLADSFNDGTIPKAALTWKEEESRGAFQSGKLIFLRNWPNYYSLFSKTDGSSQVAGKFGVTSIPALPGGSVGVSSLGGNNLAINTFGKNKGTAADFINYMVSPEVSKNRTLVTSRAPSRKALYTDPDVTGKLAYTPTLLESLNNAQPRPSVVKYGDVTTSIQDSVYGALQGRTQPEQAMADLQGRLNSLLK